MSARHESFPPRLVLGVAVALVSAITMLTAQAPQTAAAGPQGTLERIKVFGKSLEANLEGDSPDRDVVVYLPPSYAKETSRRYPVVYFLHGYSVGVEAYVRMLALPEAPDRAMGGGAVREAILVLPDAFTKYSGSMYSNSLTTGDWESFVADDLVTFIDRKYRTMAARASRGLSGHSMGGYGTMRIGMKRPDVFGALYAMSSCCLMNDPARQGGRGAGAARGDAPSRGTPGAAPETAPETAGRGRGAPGAGRGGGFANALSAQAAAWAPNPMNPPQFFDLPTKDGEIQPLIAAKWVANSPLVMVDQYVPSLKRYTAIALDVGTMDSLGASNIDLDKALTRLGVSHAFETYEGDHTSRVRERFESKVLPYFSQQLTFPGVATTERR